ncbi:hypothetical protein HDU93_008301 [Gonapodya sp. JEL0774]|nr:hypothetical protein HDU93_008301 [Gonapodya sp. JEL0774]
MTVPENWMDPWAGVWTSTNEQDSKVMDEILTIQGLSWMMRKAAAAATIQDTLRVSNDGDVTVLEVQRKSLAGEVLRKWYLDGREVEINEAPLTGHVKIAWTIKNLDDRVVLVQDTKEVSGAWSSHAEWSVETESGTSVQYRRVDFQSKAKQLKLVQKFKKTA